MLRLILILLCIFYLSACAIKPLKPWERGILAQESMRPDGHPFIKLAEDKIYFAKEASSGGQGVGGGGCGCN